MLETKSHLKSSSSTLLRVATSVTKIPANIVAAPQTISTTASRELRTEARMDASPPALTVKVHNGGGRSAGMLTAAIAGSKNVGENCWLAEPRDARVPWARATVA